MEGISLDIYSCLLREGLCSIELLLVKGVPYFEVVLR